MNPADIAAAPAATEITILSMFWTAHIVVKIVMLCLLGASVWCWAIIIDKTLLLRRLRRANERFEESFWSGNSLEDLLQNYPNARRQETPHCLFLPCANGNVRSKTQLRVLWACKRA